MFFFDKDADITFSVNSIERGYLAILGDDLNAAGAVFEALDSPRAKWGRALTGIISGYMEYFPTYFEIRNFFEIDFEFLLKNEKKDYIEYLLSSLNILSETNQEVYKYAARVFYENKFYNAALEYMEKSKKLFYRDPELHFMLAKYYLGVNQFGMADYFLNECLNIVPSYFPALKMKEYIVQNLDKT